MYHMGIPAEEEKKKGRRLDTLSSSCVTYGKVQQVNKNMRILLLFLFANGISAWRSMRFSTALHDTPWGQGLSQEDLMYKDECIVVSENDKILGHTSKYTAHRFDDPAHPQGRLHRAFSVFLFNNEGKLLLQQRAADKITFPSVWTNTCCSHPLYGYTPSEVDDEEAVATGNVNGIKFAAMRKLQVCTHIEPPDDSRPSLLALTTKLASL